MSNEGQNNQGIKISKGQTDSWTQPIWRTKGYRFSISEEWEYLGDSISEGWKDLGDQHILETKGFRLKKAKEQKDPRHWHISGE